MKIKWLFLSIIITFTNCEILEVNGNETVIENHVLYVCTTKSILLGAGDRECNVGIPLEKIEKFEKRWFLNSGGLNEANHDVVTFDGFRI